MSSRGLRTHLHTISWHLWALIHPPRDSKSTWAKFTALIQVESFHVQVLYLVKFSLKKSFSSWILSAGWKMMEGNRTGWGEHELGVGHAGSWITEEKASSMIEECRPPIARVSWI